MSVSHPSAEHPAHHGRVPERRDVVVVGGSQAGLAIGYFLAQQGRDFTILEAAGEPAATWRERWESLRLFTSARYDALPGLAFPGDPDRYPSKDEVADYLTDYARRFDLPVELGSRVQLGESHQRDVPGRARRPRDRGRPGRDRHRTVPDPVRAADRRGPRSRGRPDAQHRLPLAEATSPTGACSWSAAATPATRSPRSFPPRTRSISRSDRRRSRCRSASSAATCSGTSTRPD